MWFWWQILSLLNRMVMITAPRFFFNGWSCVENWGGGQMYVYGWRAWLKRSWKTRTRRRRRRTTTTMYTGGELGLKGVGSSQTRISISFLLLRPSFWHQRVKLEPVWYSLIPWTISQSRQTWLWSFCSTFTKRLTLNPGPGSTCMTSYPVECACWSIIIRVESIARWQRPKIWTKRPRDQESAVTQAA